MSNRDDDSNPMHGIGYGRGDDIPSSRRTAAYSFVLPKPGDKKLEPTQPSPDTLTVKDVITRLIEANSEAWARLPFRSTKAPSFRAGMKCVSVESPCVSFSHGVKSKKWLIEH